MPPFDINNAMSDPRVALGIGLLTTRTPQEGISQGIGLLSQQSQLARQREKDRQDQEYRKLMMEMKQKEADAPKYRTVGTDLVDMNTMQPVYRAPAPALTPYQEITLGNAAEDRDYRHKLQQEKLEREQKEKRDKALDSGAERYSKAIESSGIGDVLGSVESFENLTQGIEDIPGYGAGAAKPAWALDDTGKAIRQEVATIRNNILKARSGGAVTPSEADRLLQELGDGIGSTDQQLLYGINKVKNMLAGKQRNLEAGYDPGAIDLYRERGGTITSDRFKATSNTPAPAAPPAAPIDPGLDAELRRRGLLK